MLALLNYESARGRFPAHASYDADGKPLLSWRVHILPYLEEQALYEEFHLDEPWDSPHNRKLIPRMPEVFRCPSSAISDPRTVYVVPYGKGLFMEGADGLRIAEFRDGTSKTIAVVEVSDDSAVIWTKPEDYTLNEQTLADDLWGRHPAIFNAVFADGHVNAISQSIDPAILKAMLTRNGGEAVELP